MQGSTFKVTAKVLCPSTLVKSETHYINANDLLHAMDAITAMIESDHCIVKEIVAEQTNQNLFEVILDAKEILSELSPIILN